MPVRTCPLCHSRVKPLEEHPPWHRVAANREAQSSDDVLELYLHANDPGECPCNAPTCPVCAYDPVDEKRDLEDWSSVYLMANHFLHQYSMQDPAHLTYFLLR